MSAGRSFAGFIRDGKVSVLRLRNDDCDCHLETPELNDRIRGIVCGGAGAVLLSDLGTVLIMDKSAVPKPLKGLDNRQVIQITCGDHHSMALTNNSQLFVWGENSHGQLGLKKDHPGSPSAQHVESLSGIPVAQISAGGDHSFVLSLSGVVFGWGKNSAGQLGLGDTTDRHVPTIINSLQRKKIVSISCGGEHTATLSKGGAVFTFGSGGSGQLGHNSLKDEHCPRVVAELWGSKVSEVTCGREINTVFSSAASLNGSFLKTSCDEHNQTSEEHCGLDFDLVKTSFAKITGNKSLILEVMKVLQQTLLPSLNANPTGVESLRVYLLLPELIRHLQKQRTELTEALASKILQLNPDAYKVLEKYWSKLPDDWLKSLVKLFHEESAELIGQISCGEMGYELTRCLRKFLKILQMFYQVCCSANRDITNRDFIIHEINDLLVTLETTLSKLGLMFWWNAFTDDWEDMDTVNILVKYPFLTDTVSKQRMLSVKFIGEDGVDLRGLSAEFFSLISDSFLKWEKKLLEVHESSLVWFNPDNTQDNRDFYYLGVICGMAFFNHHYINIDFSLALYKKLFKLSPTLKDLEELTPVEARTLKSLLEEDEEEVVDGLGFDFTVKGKKLVPNGDQIPVTKANRQKYVDLYVDFVFNKSVKKQFKHFSEGFSKGCPLDAWSMFHPEELQELLQGSPKYNWSELQECASYESCSASDKHIKNFWAVFSELSEENKKLFLKFLYGTYRQPLGGFSKRPLKILQSDYFDAEDRLPEAQTCFDRLILPKYNDINTLRDKLIHAITKYGQLFVWGENSHGQLGLKKDHPGSPSAQHAESLSGIPVAQISAGGDHSFVLSLSGVVFGWGKNSAGQLGLGDTTEYNHEYTIDKLIAGENHSFALFFKELESKAKSNPSREVLTLNDRMIDRWLSGTDSWATIKKEINTLFSSAASLNGSFLKMSCDDHYQTSEEHCGLDFDLVKTSFAKLSEKESLISEVAKVVQQTLLPSLNLNPTGVESLRVYLLLPELIRHLKKQQRTELTEALASKILQLDPDAHKVLEMYWSRLPDDWLKRLVKLFRRASAKLIGQISSGEMGHDLTKRLKRFLKILRMIYQVCCSANRDITNRDFIIHEISDLLDTATVNILVKFPFVADTVSKQRMFQVKFMGENGVDMRGLSAEFFSLLSQSLLKWEKKVLEVHESSLVWFSLDGTQENRDFYYLGIICGMALYNHHYINLDFPLALYKKLLKLSPTLNDLEELSPVEARSLKSLLEEDEDEVVDMLFLDFTSVKKQFKHFLRGFSKGCPLDAWSMFHPEELQELLHGSPKYEWSELQQCTSYEKCSASDELIKNFWTVFFELSEENKRKFLMFLYGTDRVPVGGFSKRPLKIFQSDCPDAEDRLPEAQTCFGRLILPKYSDMDTLRNKLIHAISFCEVFGRG
ncbi:putative E3 ubiquitin- ligase HERC4 [Labeo rohita]|uniref:Putative E3 ubiquitin-ligase HERC4 n=1 Tax=Labeo rohita TaxID=84645 RepID=A0A498LL51_LABRO|nr:putative E3 ubiquitin- ligase HERC4 [Labeo rohita]